MAITSAASEAGKKFGSSPGNISRYAAASLFSISIQTGWIIFSANGAPYTASASAADRAAAETRTLPSVRDCVRSREAGWAAGPPATQIEPPKIAVVRNACGHDSRGNQAHVGKPPSSLDRLAFDLSVDHRFSTSPGNLVRSWAIHRRSRCHERLSKVVFSVRHATQRQRSPDLSATGALCNTLGALP